MSDLRKKVIKLAYTNPELRDALLPILKQAEVFDPEEIGDEEPGALEQDKDEAYMGQHFKQDWFDELETKQESGELSDSARLRKVDEGSTLPAMPAKRAAEGPLDLFADFDPMDIGKEQENAPMYNHFRQQEYGELERMLRKATIKLAYENPELREHLMPLLKEAAGTPKYKDYVEKKRKKGEKPLKKDQWESKVLNKGKKEEGKPSKGKHLTQALKHGKDVEKVFQDFGIESTDDMSDILYDDPALNDLSKKWRRNRQDIENSMGSPETKAKALEGIATLKKDILSHLKTIKNVVKLPKDLREKALRKKIQDADLNGVKAFKKDKPQKGKRKLTDSQLMQKFLSKAKPETKERMKGMSPADFVKLMGVLMDDEGAEGGGKQAALRMAVIKLAKANPELREHLIPILAAGSETFKCPECGTKVLKATGYCVKCKKKVEEKGAKEAQKKTPLA